MGFKGHLISKCLFGVFNFPKKQKKNNLTWGSIVIKSNFFVCFFGIQKKRHFEIKWPLNMESVQGFGFLLSFKIGIIYVGGK